ncbi:Protein of unknown function DUF1749 [Penicillium chermesinum]|uniref:Esterase n=1 Tax=Penicillium chermesinum TaxID=63820 RepID=A0A9W9P246_9EURO|nr:Protein of unknown function DUF1749 [Penicillium chermesinum]KAJ5232737.1 Protein of unknown function DUF1749 [Penicillium chermesinum]
MQIKSSSSLTQGEPGVLHHITSRLTAFEYTRGSRQKPHSIIFIGGLSDGLGTVEYTSDLVAGLEDTQWTLINLVLSCSYNGWGMGRLGADIDEIARCVQYIREYKEPHYGPSKIVLMGSSTGSQDVLHYLHCPNPRSAHPILDRDWTPVTRPPIEGAIMQAPVSDREGILQEISNGTDRDSPVQMRELYERAVAAARGRTFEDEVDTVVPLSVTARIGYSTTTPVSSRRFLSLISPDSPGHPTEDDLFSSDLSDGRLAETFGMVGVRGLLRQKLLVLYSGRDQSVPPEVNKQALIERWAKAIDADGSSFWDRRSLVIPNASHQLSDPDQAEPRRILVRTVKGFLEDLEEQ